MTLIPRLHLRCLRLRLDLPAQDELAGGRALGDRPQGTASVGERKRLDRRIVQPSGPAQLD